MSENVEKKRENGYYWARDHVGEAFMVQVHDGRVSQYGNENDEALSSFERDFEFIEGPLKPPAEAP